MYIAIVALGKCIEGNAPKNGEPAVGVFFFDNGPAHRSVSVKDVLAKNNVTALECAPHSPDLAPVPFYLFP
jgi:transposase